MRFGAAFPRPPAIDRLPICIFIKIFLPEKAHKYVVFSISNKKIEKRGKFFIKKAKVLFRPADIYNRSKENKVEGFRNRFSPASSSYGKEHTSKP